MSTLSFEYEADGNDEFGGRHWLSVSTKFFTGRGFFWGHREDVVSFATQLEAYPISETDFPTYRAGFLTRQGEEDHVLRATIEPVDETGTLLVRVLISDQTWRDHRLTVAFNTTYSEVASFRDQLLSLSRGEIEIAVLAGG